MIHSLQITIASSRVAALGFGLLSLSCGGGGGGGGYSPPPPPPTSNTIQVGQGGFVFSPTSLTVKTGTTVTWQWSSSGHSVTSGTNCTADNAFDTGVQNSGFSFTHTYNTVGTFNFYCTPHCTAYGMKGSITVTSTGY